MSKQTITFHWTYIGLPAAVLLLSMIITAYFYHLLPNEVAYHFKDDSPDKWISRGATIAWMLMPQLLFALLAGAIVWGTTQLSNRFRQIDSPRVKLERVLSLMGNMIALPQIILSFAMLDIFSYNSYQTHIMPLWVFALIVMGLGGVILGVLFIQAIRRILQVADAAPHKAKER